MTAKSDRARELLEDPLFKETFETVRMNYLQRVDDPRLSDEDVLKVRDLLHVLRELEATLIRTVEEGEFADFQALDKEEQDEWLAKRKTH